MDFTMQNATLEDLNELSLLMNQAHKTMERSEEHTSELQSH